VLSWTVDGVQIDVGPGDVLCIPRGVIHRFDNDHEADAKMLGESKRGQQNQSTVPSVLIKAAVCRLPMRPCSPISG
jgi:quercetin dioxygenase-like cupin family protein